MQRITMRKIMIVDDEMLVRVGIKSLINWEEYGYQVIAEAINGVDALEKIALNIPDIILTDIVMDKMDGCQLIEKCKNLYPNIQFIVLSSYNDFDNVRTAMRLGAVDYIFKLTAKPETILAALEETKKNFTGNHAPSANEGMLKRNIPVIKEKLLAIVMQQSGSRNDFFMQEWEELKLDCDFGKEQTVLYISIDDFNIGEGVSRIPETHLLKYSIANIAEEVLRNRYLAESFYYKKGDMVILLHSYGTNSYEEFKENIHEKLTRINEYVQRYLGIKVSCALSLPFIGFENFKEAVLQAKIALQARFWSSEEIYYFEEYEERECPKPILPTALSSPLLEEILNRGGFLEIQDELKSFWDGLRQSGCTNIEELRALLLNLFYQIKKAAAKREIVLDSFVDKSGIGMQSAIAMYERIEKIADAFDLLIAFYHKSFELDDGRSREEISHVRKLVWENIKQEWTVQQAAKAANMSESYFSHLFKKTCGISFIRYLNETRIKKAKELLRDTDMPIAEVAENVGIDSPNYFSILFKKYEGMSPNEYRS